MKIETLISKLGEFTHDAALIVDARENNPDCGKILWGSEAVCALTGYDQKDLIGQSFDILNGPSSSWTLKDCFDCSKDESFTPRREILTYKKNRSALWLEIDSHSAFEPTGEIKYWVTFLRDITDLKTRELAAERALESHNALETDLSEALKSAEIAKNRFWHALETLPDGFVLYDKEDRLIIANEAFLSMHQPFRDEIKPGISFEQITRRGIETGLWKIDGQDPEAWSKDILHTRRAEGQASYVIQLNDGRWLQRNDRRLPNGELVGLRIDVTDIKQQQQELERSTALLQKTKADIELQAKTDDLTGLMNRKALEEHINERLALQRDNRLMVILINLDRFKQINDTMGYEAGNHVLQSVVSALAAFVGNADRLARLGGDEFVLLREVPADAGSCRDIGRSIVETIAKPILYHERPCHVSACVGIACERPETANAVELLLDADVALNRAQQHGRGQLQVYSQEITREFEEKKRIADEILDALEKGAFFPVYQPQFDVNTLEIVGVEALARWQHPTRGVLAPISFLSIAEDMNALSEIDAQIFAQAVANMRELDNAGIETPRLSVNISLKRLCDPNLMQSIDRLDTKGLKIAFELLETIFLDDPNDDYDWTLDQLQERGIDIEVDDFGTGRASIVGLTRVKPKRLKIDRQLVIPIVEDESRRNLLAAIVNIGRSLGIGVTAEGVETMRHIRHLREMGCDTVQGFGLARPMPFNELQNVLQTTGRKLNIEA
ncbi:MAG: EAL domain-containing protein [Pseudomonadota bacterium]